MPDEEPDDFSERGEEWRQADSRAHATANPLAIVFQIGHAVVQIVDASVPEVHLVGQFLDVVFRRHFRGHLSDKREQLWNEMASGAEATVIRQ